MPFSQPSPAKKGELPPDLLQESYKEANTGKTEDNDFSLFKCIDYVISHTRVLF